MYSDFHGFCKVIADQNTEARYEIIINMISHMNANNYGKLLELLYDTQVPVYHLPLHRGQNNPYS